MSVTPRARLNFCHSGKSSLGDAQEMQLLLPPLTPSTNQAGITIATQTSSKWNKNAGFFSADTLDQKIKFSYFYKIF